MVVRCDRAADGDVHHFDAYMRGLCLSEDRSNCPLETLSCECLDPGLRVAEGRVCVLDLHSSAKKVRQRGGSLRAKQMRLCLSGPSGNPSSACGFVFLLFWVEAMYPALVRRYGSKLCNVAGCRTAKRTRRYDPPFD